MVKVFLYVTLSALIACTVFSDEPDDFVFSVEEGPARENGKGYT
jgi:hypothetical protein